MAMLFACRCRPFVAAILFRPEPWWSACSTSASAATNVCGPASSGRVRNARKMGVYVPDHFADLRVRQRGDAQRPRRDARADIARASHRCRQAAHDRPALATQPVARLMTAAEGHIVQATGLCRRRALAAKAAARMRLTALMYLPGRWRAEFRSSSSSSTISAIRSSIVSPKLVGCFSPGGRCASNPAGPWGAVDRPGWCGADRATSSW